MPPLFRKEDVPSVVQRATIICLVCGWTPLPLHQLPGQFCLLYPFATLCKIKTLTLAIWSMTKRLYGQLWQIYFWYNQFFRIYTCNWLNMVFGAWPQLCGVFYFSYLWVFCVLNMYFEFWSLSHFAMYCSIRIYIGNFDVTTVHLLVATFPNPIVFVIRTLEFEMLRNKTERW